jgi:hypothetical protein
MEFVNPLYLIGLVAIAIPVIVHLFNFRRFRKVYFTNVKFIEELRQQTQKQSQLRHLLILAMRILAIIALVLAFAQPYLPSGQNHTREQAGNLVSIYVDNSYSMQATSPDGSLLAEAARKAAEIAQAYKSSDRFQLLTNDFEAQHQRIVSRDEFAELLDAVEVSPATRPVSEVVLRQHELFDKGRELAPRAYLISDFQPAFADFGKIAEDTAVQNFLVPVAADRVANLYIDSIWFDAPVFRAGQLATLAARIKNASDQNLEKIPARLLINGKQRAIASFDIQANHETVINLPFTNLETGMQYGELSIVDSPITFDDTFYFTLTIRNEIPVLVINDPDENVFLNALFSGDSTFVLTNAKANYLDYAAFNNQNLIVLNSVRNISTGLTRELWRYVEGGGSLLIFPAPQADINSYNELLMTLQTATLAPADTLRTSISSINLQSSIYEEVFESLPENLDLPVVFSHYPLGRRTTAMLEPVLELQNGDIFLGREPSGQGMVYLAATPLEAAWSNFPKHALFVPTLYNIALHSQPPARLYYIAGKSAAIPLKAGATQVDQVVHITSQDGNFGIIPQLRRSGSQLLVYVEGAIDKAGNYDITTNDRKVAAVAFNYDRTESDVRTMSPAALEEALADAGLQQFQVLAGAQQKSLTASVAQLNSGVRLWKLFIVVALAFLFAEILLLRLWK